MASRRARARGAPGAKPFRDLRRLGRGAVRAGMRTRVSGRDAICRGTPSPFGTVGGWRSVSLDLT